MYGFKQLDIKLLCDPMDFIYPEHIAADSNVNPLFEIYSHEAIITSNGNIPLKKYYKSESLIYSLLFVI